MMNVNVKLKQNAKLPIKGTKDSAGYDIHSFEDKVVKHNSRTLISTGVFLENMPNDHYIRIAPRSGLSVKHSIDIGAGVVDSDYRGELKIVVCNNHVDKDFTIHVGDRIAQLIITKFEPNTVMVGKYEDGTEINEKLDDLNLRGIGGFGSTGK